MANYRFLISFIAFVIYFLGCTSTNSRTEKQYEEVTDKPVINEILPDSLETEKLLNLDFNQNIIDTNWCTLKKNVQVRIIANRDHQKINLVVFSGNKECQTIDSLHTQHGLATPIIEDLNADGYNDLKIYYGAGARGANELYHIFIQNPKNGNLVKLKNSERYPNITRDTDNNDVVAYLYHGGVTLMKFKIENYALIPVESINSGQDLEYTIKEYSVFKDGKQVLVKVDSVKDNGRSIHEF